MGANTAKLFLAKENPQQDLTTNNLDMAVYVTHLHNFAPLMKLLENISTNADNTVAEGWAKSGSVSSSSVDVQLLCKIS